MRSLENAKHAEKQRNLRLQNVLMKKIDEDGVALNENDCNDVTTIVANVSPLVESYPESSIQRIFWEQQSNYNHLKDKRQMRWHPLLNHFALNIKYSSASAYRAIKDSEIISLPSERTLRDYTHWVSTEAGPQVQVIKHIKKTINFDEMSISVRYFALAIDEMKVQSGLVFQKYTGELVGFCNLGQVNEDLERLAV